MKRLIPAAVLMATLASPAYAVTINQKMDEFKADHIAQGSANFAALQSKITVINFWATWCESCKVEIKEMQAQFKPLFATPKFNLMFVSLDTRPEKASAWFKENLPEGEGYLKYLYKDPDFAMATKYDLQSFPSTLVIDNTGKVVHIESGFAPGKGQTEKLVGVIQKMLPR